jgi:hypothetical protein
LKSVIEIVITTAATAKTRGLAKKLCRETPMTIEILYLTARLHQWLNERVARHIATQAAKLSR